MRRWPVTSCCCVRGMCASWVLEFTAICRWGSGRIVREEMDRIGQEFHLPALNPREIWEESGRWTDMGDNMFRLRDRKGAELALAAAACSCAVHGARSRS